MTRGFLRPLTPYALFQSHQKMIYFQKAFANEKYRLECM